MRPAVFFRAWVSLLLLAAAAGWHGLAAAQQAPPAVDPGRVRERFETPPAPAAEPPAPGMEAPRDATAAALAGVRFTLREVRIDNATVLPVPLLQARADALLGRELTGSDIAALAAGLTALYRNAGYLLSLVTVPAQRFEDGLLVLSVVEGYVDKVTLQAGPEVPAGLRARLAGAAERIRASRPLSVAVLERQLLIANDFPGLQLRSVLMPSATPGAADLLLIASVKKFEGFVALDNYGSDYLGPGQLGVGLTGNQLLGINDQWRLIVAGTGNREMGFAQLGYSQFLGDDGLRLSAALSSARTRPGDLLESFDVRGKAETLSLGLSYPWLRSRNRSLWLRAAWDHNDVRTDILGTRVIEDHIRALRLGLTWRALDRLDGQSVLDIDLSQGLGGTRAADPLKSRAGADGDFFKLGFDVERYQPLGAGFSISAGAAGQWTDRPLLSSEQYALGGRRYGRAYEPAELVGERALALRVEPRHQSGSDAGVWQLFGFYDIGKVWREQPVGTGVPASQSLASAGFGVRLLAARRWQAVLEAAWPLTKPLAIDQAHGRSRRARLLASLVWRF